MASKKVDLSEYNMTVEEVAKATAIIDRYELARTYQFPFWNDFDRYYKMYESYVNDAKVAWETKIFIPMVFSVIERYLPRILSNKPTVNYMARNENTVKQAQTNQALFDWEWDQVSRRKDGGMYLEMLRFAKDAFITGTGIAKIPWIKEMQNVKSFNEKNEVTQVNKKVFDGPDFEVVDPYDFFFDPEAYDVQRASWVIHRTRRTLQELKDINATKGIEIYKNLNLLEHMAPDNLSATENDYKMRRKTALGSGQVLVQDRTIDKFELMECWGLFPVYDKDGEKTEDLEERVVTLANRKTVIRDVDYPYWHGKKPFIKYTPIPRTFDFYGVPIIKHLERMQYYMNEFIDQKFDNQVMSLNQMLVVGSSAGVEDWQLVWRPGGVIRASDINQVKPLPLGDVTAPIDTSVAYLSQVSQLTTGLSDYYTTGTGATNDENKTATGANLITNQMEDRVKQMTLVLEEEVIRELGSQWHKLNQQFVRLPMIIRVTGPNGKPDFPLIKPEDVRHEFDIVPEAGSTQPQNKDLMRQQFANWLTVISKTPMAMVTDWAKVAQKGWELLGYKEFDQMTTMTAGSQPDALQQGQQPQQPGQGQPMPQATGAPAQMGQMLAGATQGQPGPQRGAPQGAPGAQAAKPAGTVTTKFEDLTLEEQKQWLAKLGITADTLSRLQNMSQQADQMKADRAMELIKQHLPGGELGPVPPQMTPPMSLTPPEEMVKGK